MNLKEIYSNQKVLSNAFGVQKLPVISCEVFPPKNDLTGEKAQTLYKELEILKKYEPSLISVTYGAGGSNRNSSLEIIKHIKDELNLNVMPHFTCICSQKSSIENYLQEILDLGIENILALRGDEPQDIDVCHLDFRYANELVDFIKSKTNLSIGVAGYPEGHIDAENLFTDIENLKRKVDAGADVVYTQLFFDNTKFFSFVQLARDAGINVPIVAGILPVISYHQLEKMLAMAKVAIPKAFLERLEKFKDNKEDVIKLGIEFASYQVQQLVDAEVQGIHFYTLNRAHSTYEILENLIG